MGSQPYSLDDEHNNMVGLNRSMGSQPYPLDDEHNTMVELNRSMGSQPYPLDDEHNDKVGDRKSTRLTHLIVVLVIKRVGLGSH
jgi:H2-forming N5,N10-methylenetetrahydromethanopterin dehydrogenase-like enzyme